MVIIIFHSIDCQVCKNVSARSKSVFIIKIQKILVPSVLSEFTLHCEELSDLKLLDCFRQETEGDLLMETLREF